MRETPHSLRAFRSHAPACGKVPWRCRDGQAERLPTGHEDVLTAVVVERFAGESAIESFQPQARDVELTTASCPAIG